MSEQRTMPMRLQSFCVTSCLLLALSLPQHLASASSTCSLTRGSYVSINSSNKENDDSLSPSYGSFSAINSRKTVPILRKKSCLLDYFKNKNEENFQCDDLEFAPSSKNEALTTALDSISRGGSLFVEEEEEEEVSIVVKKLRNLIRSMLSISENNVPALANVLKSMIEILESVTGTRLLPVKKKKSKKKNRSNKKKASSKESVEEEDDEKDTGAVASKKRKKTTKKTGESTSSSTNKKKSSAGGNRSGSAAAHLAKELKSTNPNYRIQRELKEFLKSPPPNLKVNVGKNIRLWIITVTGAKNTLYEGEKYRLRVQFPADYPTSPPSVYFLQPTPRHEHVYTNGDICLSLLGKDWRPTMTAQSIAMSILSILSGAQRKSLPMDNARQCLNKPGGKQDDWVYHDDNC